MVSLRKNLVGAWRDIVNFVITGRITFSLEGCPDNEDQRVADGLAFECDQARDRAAFLGVCRTA